MARLAPILLLCALATSCAAARRDDDTDTDGGDTPTTPAPAPLRVCRSTVDLGLGNPTTAYLAFFFAADGTPHVLEGDFLVVDYTGLSRCLSRATPPRHLAALRARAGACAAPGAFAPHCDFRGEPCACRFTTVAQLSSFCLPRTDLVTPVTDQFKLDGGACTAFLAPA